MSGSGSPAKQPRMGLPDVVNCAPTSAYTDCFIHGLTNLKQGANGGFFECRLQISADEYVRGIGFSSKQHEILLGFEKRPVRIHTKPQPDSRNSGKMVFVIGDRTRIEAITSMSFQLKKPSIDEERLRVNETPS